MKITKYLAITSKGKTKITENQPSLSQNEISLRLEINLPDELFKKPQLQASIEIPKEAVQTVNLTTSVTNDIAKIIKGKTNLDVAVKVLEHIDSDKTLAHKP